MKTCEKDSRFYDWGKTFVNKVERVFSLISFQTEEIYYGGELTKHD